MSESLFEQATIRKELKNGRYSIKCVKGLWAVDAPNKSEATREALHYFSQYLEDGEYSYLKEQSNGR
jgi:hypothetical protein